MGNCWLSWCCGLSGSSSSAVMLPTQHSTIKDGLDAVVGAPPGSQLKHELGELLTAITQLLDTPLAMVSLCHDTGVNEIVSFATLSHGTPTLLHANDCAWSCLAQHSWKIVCGEMQHASSRGGAQHYCASPLIACNGHVWGALCLLDIEPSRVDAGVCRMVNNFAEIAVRILERHSSVCNQPGKMHKGIRKLDHAGICEHANKLRLVDSVADDNQPPHPQQTFARQTRTAACVQDSCVLLVDTATPGWQIIWADRTWEHWSGFPSKVLVGCPLASAIQPSTPAAASIQWDLLQADAKSQARFVLHAVTAHRPGCSPCEGSRAMDLSFRPLALDILDSDALLVGAPSCVAMTARNMHLWLYAVRVYAASTCNPPWQPLLPSLQAADNSCNGIRHLASSLFTNLALHQWLGAGAHGQVYSGHWHGAKVVVKLQDHNIEDSRDLQEAQLEVAVGQLLRHPHLVRTLGHGAAQLDASAVQAAHSWRLPAVGSSHWESNGGQRTGTLSSALQALTSRLPAAESLINNALLATDMVIVCSDIDGMGPEANTQTNKNSSLSTSYLTVDDIQVVAKATSASRGCESSSAANKPASTTALHASGHPSVTLPDSIAYPIRLRTLAVQEFADGGTLQDVVGRASFRSGCNQRLLSNVLALARDIAAGCEHLHYHGVVHADLSASNVLLFSKKPVAVGSIATVAVDKGYSRQLSRYTLDAPSPGTTLPYVAKVADFGKARLLGPDGHCTVSILATLAYMAPEAIERGLLSPAADVYSFGVLLWQMLDGRQPWAGLGRYDIITSVLAGERQLVWPEAGDDVSDETKAAWTDTVYLGQCCTQRDVLARPSMSDAVQIIDTLLSKMCGRSSTEQ